jgi:hypothetical protein
MRAAVGDAHWVERRLGSCRRDAGGARGLQSRGVRRPRQASVNASRFGKLFTLSVDDEIYTQPLYASSVPFSSGTRNAVYATALQH